MTMKTEVAKDQRNREMSNRKYQTARDKSTGLQRRREHKQFVSYFGRSSTVEVYWSSKDVSERCRVDLSAVKIYATVSRVFHGRHFVFLKADADSIEVCSLSNVE